MDDDQDPFSFEVDELRGKKNGYYVRKRTIVLVGIAAVVVIVVVGVIAAFLGPGKGNDKHEGKAKGKECCWKRMCVSLAVS